MADSLIEAAKEALGSDRNSAESIDAEFLEEHQEELREQMTDGAGGCLHVSLAAAALRKNRDADCGGGDTDDGTSPT